jgi:hypothetical protein
MSLKLNSVATQAVLNVFAQGLTTLTLHYSLNEDPLVSFNLPSFNVMNVGDNAKMQMSQEVEAAPIKEGNANFFRAQGGGMHIEGRVGLIGSDADVIINNKEITLLTIDEIRGNEAEEVLTLIRFTLFQGSGKL